MPPISTYAFPGGSVAVTRGILVELESEAELAGLLGHEIGHVCARHAAEQASKGMIANIFMTGAALATSAAGYGGASESWCRTSAVSMPGPSWPATAATTNAKPMPSAWHT